MKYSLLRLNYYTYAILDAEKRHHMCITKEETEKELSFIHRANIILSSLNNTCRSVRVIFAGLNQDGDPDFAFCKIKITEVFFQNATLDDYFAFFIARLTETAAREFSFDSKLIYFETDESFARIQDKFAWESASEFDLTDLDPKYPNGDKLFV